MVDDAVGVQSIAELLVFAKILPNLRLDLSSGDFPSPELPQGNDGMDRAGEPCGLAVAILPSGLVCSALQTARYGSFGLCLGRWSGCGV